MKYYLTYFMFFTILNLFAQDPQLFDYQWCLEKIVTADSTLVVPDNILTQSSFETENYFFGNCIDFISLIIYDDINQVFQLSEGSVPLSPNCNPELFDVDEFYIEEFLFDQPFISFFNPFSYSFTTQNNLIYLEITNSEGSVATFYDNFLSQDEFLKQNLKIYPNPVKDRLFIESPSLAIKKTQIYDLNGKVILEYYSSDNNSLDLSQLERGIYILKIETSNAQINKKLIKE